MHANLAYDFSRTHVVHVQMLVDGQMLCWWYIVVCYVDSLCQQWQHCFT
jgi:hypothetical protein